MSNIFRGKPWEKVAEQRAKKICRRLGQPESLWEMMLIQANESMLKDIIDDEE